MDEGQVEHQPAKQLPKALAAGLAPRMQQALSHPIRRQVLRTLNRDLVPRAPSELTSAAPAAGLSALQYHALVLEDAKTVRVSGTRQTDHGLTPLYVSTVAGNRSVVSVLKATEEEDDREA